MNIRRGCNVSIFVAGISVPSIIIAIPVPDSIVLISNPVTSDFILIPGSASITLTVLALVLFVKNPLSAHTLVVYRLPTIGRVTFLLQFSFAPGKLLLPLFFGFHTALYLPWELPCSFLGGCSGYFFCRVQHEQEHLVLQGSCQTEHFER